MVCLSVWRCLRVLDVGRSQCIGIRVHFLCPCWTLGHFPQVVSLASLELVSSCQSTSPTLACLSPLRGVYHPVVGRLVFPNLGGCLLHTLCITVLVVSQVKSYSGKCTGAGSSTCCSCGPPQVVLGRTVSDFSASVTPLLRVPLVSMLAQERALGSTIVFTSRRLMGHA